MAEATQAVRHTKELTGLVVRVSMKSTIVVEVTRLAPHPFYKKVVKYRKTYFAHDAKGTAKVGDKVRILETKPVSKLKRWRLVEVLKA